MKKSLLTIVPLLSAFALTSCFKNKVEPVGGKNSVIYIEDMKINNLISQGFPEIKGVAIFEFKVQNIDTPGAPLDVVAYTDTFDIMDATGFDQRYDFDTPDKTKTFNFDLHILIRDGEAQSASGRSIRYVKGDKTLLDNALSFSGTGSMFVAPRQTVNF